MRVSVRRRLQAGSARPGDCGDFRLFGRAPTAYESVVGAAWARVSGVQAAAMWSFGLRSRSR